MKTKITQFAILSLLLIGIGVASTSSVAAQRRGRNWDGYPNWGGSYQLRETALNAGYNDGSKEGRNDRNRNRYRGASEFGAYQNATKDYSSRLGDRDPVQATRRQRAIGRRVSRRRSAVRRGRPRDRDAEPVARARR